MPTYFIPVQIRVERDLLRQTNTHRMEVFLVKNSLLLPDNEVTVALLEDHLAVLEEVAADDEQLFSSPHTAPLHRHLAHLGLARGLGCTQSQYIYNHILHTSGWLVDWAAHLANLGLGCTQSLYIYNLILHTSDWPAGWAVHNNNTFTITSRAGLHTITVHYNHILHTSGWAAHNHSTFTITSWTPQTGLRAGLHTITIHLQSHIGLGCTQSQYIYNQFLHTSGWAAHNHSTFTITSCTPWAGPWAGLHTITVHL